MSGSKFLPSPLDEGREWLQLKKFDRAADCFRRCEASIDRDMGLAEALLGSGGAPEAYRILVVRFLVDGHTVSRESRGRMVELLRLAAHIGDPELESLLDGRPAEPTANKESVLKAFYFRCPQGSDSLTLWERVSDAHRNIDIRRDRTITAQGYTIEFAKTFSSATPLMDLSPDRAAGGGYFLNLGGFGCVIDPGYGFLNNFYALKHTLYDIDCIIVTHFHDDHYADLPALLSLLYLRKPAAGGAAVRLFLDCETYRRFRPIIDFSTRSRRGAKTTRAASYIQDATVLRRRGQKPIRLAEAIELRAFPTKHDVFGKNTGVGLEFTLHDRHKHVVITGDTGWTPAFSPLPNRVPGYDVVLVAHVSSARRQEASETLAGGQEWFYSKHLCVHGVCKVIEAVHPQTVILSEIGQELEGVVNELAALLATVYGVRVQVGARAAGPFSL